MRFYTLLIFLFVLVNTFSSDQISVLEHPRLFWTSQNDSVVRHSLKSSVYAERLKNLSFQCDTLINTPLLERKKIGKRLLSVSREAERRIIMLSFMWRLTGDERYAERAKSELINVCSFSDWNPSHFLDVAEMCIAVSVGYDWLYNWLDEKSKKYISERLYRLGGHYVVNKRPSSMNCKDNWNQVCNSGVTIAAIALADDVINDYVSIINKSLMNVLRSQMEYGVNGAYPEGHVYWEFGTGYNVLLYSAIETAFKGTIKIDYNKKFMQSPFYIANMRGPIFKAFNYADNSEDFMYSPCLFWFALKLNKTCVAEYEYSMLNNKSINHRLMPLGLIWSAQIDNSIDFQYNPPLYYVDNGFTPVFTIRSSWSDNNCWFIGAKGGKVNSPHGHMDVGSFVLDAGGVRWVSDLGPEPYNNIESKGIDLWNMKTQDCDRWNLFRYGFTSHNTLSFDDKPLLINKYCDINVDSVSNQDIVASVDLSPLYNQMVVKRSYHLVGNKYFELCDEVKTTEKGTIMSWRIITSAKVNIIDDYTVYLHKDGRTMMLHVDTDNKISFNVAEAKPKNDFESNNEGYNILSFNSNLMANSKNTFNTIFKLIK